VKKKTKLLDQKLEPLSRSLERVESKNGLNVYDYAKRLK